MPSCPFSSTARTLAAARLLAETDPQAGITLDDHPGDNASLDDLMAEDLLFGTSSDYAPQASLLEDIMRGGTALLGGRLDAGDAGYWAVGRRDALSSRARAREGGLMEDVEAESEEEVEIGGGESSQDELQLPGLGSDEEAASEDSQDE